MLTEAEILSFIRNFRGAESVFLNGCCYWFAAILNARFPQMGYIFYNPVDNHFAWKYDGVYYDVTGQCDKEEKETQGRWLLWEYYRHKFPLESLRIEIGCILKIDNPTPFSAQVNPTI